MKYAILGGGGSFGLHAAAYLLDTGAEKVIGVGRNLLRVGAFSMGLEKRKGFEYHARHITYELDLLLELLDKERPEVIVNFAAQGERAVSFKNSWRFFETNCVGLSRLVEELMKRDYVRRFVQIGTSEHYGSVVGPAKEDAPINPSTPYGISKIAFDLYLMQVHKEFGFPMNVLRPCNAYGSGQLLHRVIPKAVYSAMSGGKFPLHGGGKAEKSFIHSRDLARAIHMIVESNHVGCVFNIGPKQPTPIREVISILADRLGKKLSDISFDAPERIAEDARYWLDSSAIKDAVGWEQTIDWPEGFDDVIGWAKLNWAELKDTSTEYVMRA